ncbi:type II toxin-antitoxin system VapC family toxin [Blastomonas sp. SL216]|uniref:type II toxin-antitoxin system VapC family toxin n=1 Tax=Blastomonas sp. SL216 TaxID=2995169 RepID=UPI0023773991|nr:type II toxin-antitoxin system VapC family toxin [Blastomonas sp. SL216]
MIFDTNVVIDLIEGSSSPLFDDNIARLMTRHRFFINEIIFAELAGRYASSEEVSGLLHDLGLHMARLTLPDCYRAGVAFHAYRKNGGARTTILPDFLIGAHAAGQGWPLVTRDRKGFAAYFPEVELIDPMKVSND